MRELLKVDIVNELQEIRGAIDTLAACTEGADGLFRLMFTLFSTFSQIVCIAKATKLEVLVECCGRALERYRLGIESLNSEVTFLKCRMGSIETFSTGFPQHTERFGHTSCKVDSTEKSYEK